MSRRTRKPPSLIRLTSNMYHGHKKRARKAGAAITYSLSQLRQLVQTAIDSVCPHCHEPLCLANISIDHAQPVCRSGPDGFEFDNLEVCCRECNLAKGPLTDDEFDALLRILASFPKPIAENTLARLRAGNRARLNLQAHESPT